MSDENRDGKLTGLAAPLVATAGRLISGAQVRWAGCSPDMCQRIYFANHSSHLDFLVLWSALPSEVRRLTRPVAAQDYWETSRLRRFFAERLFNAVLVERRRLAGPNDAIDRMSDALGEGYSLILFPEGARGSGQAIAPFRSGLYNLVLRRPDVELVPVCLENLNRVLPKGEIVPAPLTSFITFGTPMQLLEDESREAFLKRARGMVLDLRRA